MSVRVIIPPAAIVTPAEILGDHGSEDAAVKRMIAAATRTIDGPNGWLKRCLGPQTLELTMDRWCGQNHRLPCGPVIKINSVRYLDAAGGEQTVDETNWKLFDDRIWFMHSFGWPGLGAWPGAVRIRYEAGYNGVGEGETGDVPPEAVQAVILMVQQMKASSSENLFLRSVEIPDVETRTYTISDAADGLVKRAVENLLSGLRVYSL